MECCIRKGHEPRLYPYIVEHVPIGSFEAVLDLKYGQRKLWGSAAISAKKNQV